MHWQSLMMAYCPAALRHLAAFLAAEFACGAGDRARRAGWAVIAYTAIFPPILSQVFYIRGVELIGANRAGLFINLVPIFGTLLSILILGEDFQRLSRYRDGAGARRHRLAEHQRAQDGNRFGRSQSLP